MKKLVGIILAGGLMVSLAACTSDADVASENLSNAAEQFEIERRVIFYNGITEEVLLEIQGFCSIEDQGNQLEVTCRNESDSYTKDFLGLSDNVTYFVEQLEGKDVSVYHRRVNIKPENILPEFDLETGKQ